MYQYTLICYMIWKHLYLLEYGYNAYYYGKYISNLLIRSKKSEDEWVILDDR